MPSLDLIQASLAAPMDWRVVESLASEILLQDDLPGLQKLGGIADGGADAVQESFYGPERRTSTVVQITSDEAQVAKYRKTVKRLREAQIEFDQLIIVYRQPVSSTIRRQIQEAGLADHIAVDIRDEGYLVGQLGKLANGLFARYFQDASAQMELLLGEADPLDVASDRLRHAMLASLAAYVVSPESARVRNILFDRTVLAAIVASREHSLAINTIQAAVEQLIPNEPITRPQISDAISRLSADGLCVSAADGIRATEAALDSMGSALLRIRTAFQSMLAQLVTDTARHHKLTDADRGRVERNLRRA